MHAFDRYVIWPGSLALMSRTTIATFIENEARRPKRDVFIELERGFFSLSDDKTGDIVVGPMPVVSLQHGNAEEQME